MNQDEEFKQQILANQAGENEAEKNDYIRSLEHLLEDLTPGGSEFHGDPEKCHDFIKDRMTTNGKLAARNKSLEHDHKVMREALESIGTVCDRATNIKVATYDTVDDVSEISRTALSSLLVKDGE